MKKMKKAISVFTALTVTFWLCGIYMVLPVHADFADGDLVRETDEFDVYIVKLVGAEKFKRLILNPDVFNMYGHLEWGDVQVVADGALADYATSELVRELNDDKVYKLYPDGDVGTKKWVETLDCFNSQGFDWDSVYIINSFDRDSYTTASEALCGGAVVAGDITLSLGPDTPGAVSVPYNARSLPVLDVKATGSGTISQLVLKRSGVGESADFANVYLYEGATRLTSGRSISSSTNKTTFIGLSISAPTVISVVVDLANSSGDNGHINVFSVESASDVTSDATVGGTFPITGNLVSITSIQGGTITAVDNGSISNPTVGQAGAQVTQFKLTTAYEAIDIERVTLYNGGTMNSTEMTNLELKVSGTVVATADAFNSSDLATFVFDTPYNITKGDSEIFKVYADLQGDKDDTIIIYFEVSADIKGIGASFGYPVYVDIDGMDSTTSGESHTLTLEGGEVTIAFNGPVADNIADDTDDTVFLDFAITAASDLEIRKMQAYMCFYEEGTLHNIDALTEHIDEVEDIKVKNKDTGVILMGPTDGANFTLEAAGVNVCGTAAYGVYKEWSDIWDLDAGETVNLQITGDIEADADTDADDQWKTVLRGYTNLTNPIKYRGTNDYVASGDIVPSTDISGNLMTLKSSTIDVAVAALPTSAVYGVKAQTGVEAMGLIFTAGDASDMTLSDLVLTSYVKSEGDGTENYLAGNTQSGGGGLYVKNVVTNVTLYEDDGTTKIAGPKGFSGGTNDSDVTFDDLEWVISAGADKKMLVVVDITTTATSDNHTNNYDLVAFDITDVADVTALDSEGTSRNSASEDINGTIASSPTVYVYKSDGGTLALAEAASGIRPETSYVYQGQTGALMSKFKFTTTREAFQIDKLLIQIDDDADKADISKVELSYPINAAGDLVSPRPYGSFGATGTVTFDLTDREMYIPKDDYAYIEVYADITTYTAVGAQSLDDFSLDIAGDAAAEFHATGVGSSVVKDGDDISETTAQQFYLKRNFPTFTLDGPASSTGATAPTTILEFTVTNNGDYDLVFDSTSGMLLFEVQGSGDLDVDPVFTLYKANGTQVDAATVIVTDAITSAGEKASAIFDFTDTTITIAGGGSQAFYIDITSNKTAWDENGDYFQIKMIDEIRIDDTNSVVAWYDGADLTSSSWTQGLKEVGIPLIGPEFSISGL